MGVCHQQAYHTHAATSSSLTQWLSSMVATMAALITREDLGPDPDILSKFSAVAVARTACIEDNRARENARENIRKKLAMEAGREKQDSCDLQICFMNEIESDDELELGENVDAATTAEALLRANISQKVGQIIVPMEGRKVKAAEMTEEDEEEVKPPTREEDFQRQVEALQSAARQGLVEARAAAHRDLQERINSRRRTNDRLVSLLGLPHFSKFNRRTLSRLNVAQLQLIQNDYLAQIETLNEELVGLLVTRDELGMEQDAMLTDIEDLSEFINIEKA